MARALRYDTHRLDGVETLPSGALRVPARVARVGVLEYDDGQGNTWGELVPESTLFSSDSMATLRGVALTDLHPGALVTPETRKGLQVGHVGDVIARDGAYLSAPVYVTDAEAIARVQSGERRDVSCGYSCDLDETPGTWEGKPYRAIQRARVYNHIGIGPEGWGRAGTDVSLRLDGSSEPAGARVPVARLDSGDSGDSQTAHPAAHASPAVQPPPQGAQKTSTSTGATAPINPPRKGTRSAMAQKTTTRTTRRDGTEPPIKTEDKDKKVDAEGDEMAEQKIDSPDLGAQLDAANDALMEAMKTIATLKAQLAVSEATKPEVTEETVPAEVADSIVSKRLAKLVSATTDAKLVAPAVKLDGLVSTRKVHEAALTIVVPEMKFDGLTDERVAGMFDALAATAKKAAEKSEKTRSDSNTSRTVRNDALGAAHRAAAIDPNATDDDTAEAAERKMRADARDDWKTAKPNVRVGG